MNMQHIRWKHYIHKTSGEKYLGQYLKKPKHFRDIQYYFLYSNYTTKTQICFLLPLS